MAGTVGHDINYAGVAGVIHAIGPRGSGRGQVIDVSMLDASALMMAKWFGEHAAGSWPDERGVNRIDGGSHYYQIYRTADGHEACVTPVSSLAEATQGDHVSARQTFIDVDGIVQAGRSMSTMTGPEEAVLVRCATVVPVGFSAWSAGR